MLPSQPSAKATTRRGLTLAEVLVVLGIMSLLMGLLMPALSRARAVSRQTACGMTLKQIGTGMAQYAQDWRGFYVPPRVGANVRPELRWPQVIFGPIDERSISCTSYVDVDGEISYLANARLEELGVRFHSKPLLPASPAETIAAGEKFDRIDQYYLNANEDDYRVMVDERRHLERASNYLFLDLHVTAVRAPLLIIPGLKHPWDIQLP